MSKSELLSTTTFMQAQPDDDGSKRPARALYSIPDARLKSGNIGNTKAYELIGEGKWVAVKLGARTFITAELLDAHIASLPRADIGQCMAFPIDAEMTPDQRQGHIRTSQGEAGSPQPSLRSGIMVGADLGREAQPPDRPHSGPTNRHRRAA